MADEYQTPPATVTPSIETPAPIPSGSGVQSVRAKPEPERTWKRQLELDFGTVKREVEKSMRMKAVAGKWSIKSAEEQRRFLEEEIEKELTRRERRKNTTTARSDYPEIWDKEYRNVVEKWVDKLEMLPRPTTLDAVPNRFQYDSDRDDEEQDLPRGIKREFQDNEEGSSNSYVSHKRLFKPSYREPSADESSDGHSDDSESEDGEEGTVNAGGRAASKKPCRGKAANAAKAVACTRGLDLIIGSPGSESVDVRVSTPTWAWKNGHLFVWPAIAGMAMGE